MRSFDFVQYVQYVQCKENLSPYLSVERENVLRLLSVDHRLPTWASIYLRPSSKLLAIYFSRNTYVSFSDRKN